MNNGSPIRILVFGPDYSGKTTLAGHLLYKCGKLGPEMKETLRKQKVDEGKEPNQWAESLCVKDSDMFFFPRFYKSPKYEVIIADSTSISFFPGGHQAVCVVLMVAASQWEFETSRDVIQKELLFISQLGVKHIVVCVNKMDLTQPPYSQQRYDFIQQEIHSYIQDMERDGFTMGTVDFLPISALAGDNLQEASPQTPWFEPETIEGRAGGTLIGITLHQLLCSFSSRKPRWDPLSACPDLYSKSEIRALTLESKAAQASVHHQPSSSGPLGGLRDDPSVVPPKGLDAQQGAASAAGGELGARKAGRPSVIVAAPPQRTLPSFSTLMPYVKKSFRLPCHQQNPSSSSSSSLSSSSLQLTQAMTFPLLCVPYQGLVSEAPPGPSLATQPAFLPIVNQSPSSSHQPFPSLLPFQNSFRQDQHAGAQNPPAPFLPLFLMPAQFYVQNPAASQQPFAQSPLESQPLPILPPLLPPLPPPLPPPLCPSLPLPPPLLPSLPLSPLLPLSPPVFPPPPYSPPPPYTSPLPHPPGQPFPPAPCQPQGTQTEALPQAQPLALPLGWLTEDPEAEFPPEPVFPPRLTPPSPFQPPLSPVEYPPRSSS